MSAMEVSTIQRVTSRIGHNPHELRDTKISHTLGLYIPGPLFTSHLYVSTKLLGVKEGDSKIGFSGSTIHTVTQHTSTQSLYIANPHC